MDVAELSSRLQQALAANPHVDRLSFIRGWVANLPPGDQIAATALMGLLSFYSPPQEGHVLVLLHGIRTAAIWQEAVRSMFNGTSIRVIPIGYEYLDVFRFLIPFWRSGPVSRVAAQMQSIKRDNPNVHISVIAHSFGTFIISRILSPDQGIRIKRLLLCGSVLPATFAWENVQGRPSRDALVNDVGSRDVWPVLARTMTWGFGSSGTFGFKQAAVTDRFHNLTHSDFFSEEWVKEYWLPFICDGTIIPSKWESERPTPPVWLNLLALFHLKYVVPVVLLIVILAWRLWK